MLLSKGRKLIATAARRTPPTVATAAHAADAAAEAPKHDAAILIIDIHAD